MSEPKKYHINKNNEVAQCHANKRKCRYGDSLHSTDYNEIKMIAEQRLQKELGEESGVVLSKRKEHLSENMSRIHNAVKGFNNKTTLDEITTVGAMVNEEVKSRLSFDPDSINQEDFTEEQCREIQNTNRNVISELTTVGAVTGIHLVGSSKKVEELNRIIAILPDGAKKLTPQTTMLVKSVNINNNEIYGQYTRSKKAKYTTSNESTIDDTNIAQVADEMNNGDIYTQTFVSPSEVEDGKLPQGTGFSGYQKVDDNTVRNVWIGTPPTKKKKMGTGVVIKNMYGEDVNLPNQDYYENRATMFGNVQELLIPSDKHPKSFIDSVTTHEYTHAIQHGRMEKEGLQNYESQLYRKLVTGSTIDNMEKNFPVEYMGHRAQRELLTVATEGFFHPASYNGGRYSIKNSNTSHFLYGKDRHQNSDTIKNWIAGQWLKFDHEGKTLQHNNHKE